MAVQITATMVKELREMTGAGPLDCKKALVENDGNLQKSADYLREKGIAKAQKKLSKGRTMNEGVIEIYQHFNQRMAVIVEVNCETDFVANTDKFRTFAKDVALHISSMSPLYITREDVPAELVEKERDIMMKQPDLENKPDNIKEKIVEGRLDKFYKEIVLMEQEFIKDDNKSINDILQAAVAELGESIQISRFARYALGEGDQGEAGDEE